MDEIEDGALIDGGRTQSSLMGDERHDGGIIKIGLGRVRKKVFEAEQLSGEHTVESRKTEAPFSADEIGKMRGLESGLTSEKRAGELAAVDAASHFRAKALVELGKIHLWNFGFKLYTPVKKFADCKARRQCLSAIRV
jgi:hypothetical protein